MIHSGERSCQQLVLQRCLSFNGFQMVKETQVTDHSFLLASLIFMYSVVLSQNSYKDRQGCSPWIPNSEPAIWEWMQWICQHYAVPRKWDFKTGQSGTWAENVEWWSSDNPLMRVCYLYTYTHIYIYIWKHLGIKKKLSVRHVFHINCSWVSEANLPFWWRKLGEFIRHMWDLQSWDLCCVHHSGLCGSCGKCVSFNCNYQTAAATRHMKL